MCHARGQLGAQHGIQLGAHTQPFSGSFGGDNFGEMTLLLPSLSPRAFVDFVKRVATDKGPNAAYWKIRRNEVKRGGAPAPA